MPNIKEIASRIPSHIFRGYDIRGLIGSELTLETYYIFGRAYGTWLAQRRIHDCVIGYDCRNMSYEFSEKLIEGLTDSGIDVYNIGMTLSQIVYFSGYYFRTKGCLMVTASHNPKEFNGLKIGTGFSETTETEEVIAFRDLVQKGNFIEGKTKGKVEKCDIFEIYIKDIQKRIGKVRSFKVVIDGCSATAGAFLPKIFREFGCEVIEQNTVPNGNFPTGTPDPTEKYVQERLAKRVVEEKADLGFSFDCDGDRIGVVDGRGNLIWNDTLVSLFSKDVLDFIPNAKIIYNVLCSKQVDEVIRNSGGLPIIWRTGHSFIKAKVKEEKAILGGELSGHFFFIDNFYGHDDSAIASFRLLEYLTRTNQSLEEAISKLPQYISSPEIKLGCPDNLKFEIISKIVTEKVKEIYPVANYINIDGIRMDTKDRMLVIRASNNGPYITVKFEAKDSQSYQEIKEQIKKILESIKEIDWNSGGNIESLEK